MQIKFAEPKPPERMWNFVLPVLLLAPGCVRMKSVRSGLAKKFDLRVELPGQSSSSSTDDGPCALRYLSSISPRSCGPGAQRARTGRRLYLADLRKRFTPPFLFLTMVLARRSAWLAAVDLGLSCADRRHCRIANIAYFYISIVRGIKKATYVEAQQPGS